MRRREFLAISSGSAIAAMASPLANGDQGITAKDEARVDLPLWYKAPGGDRFVPASTVSSERSMITGVRVHIHGVEMPDGETAHLDRLSVDIVFPNRADLPPVRAFQQDCGPFGHRGRPVTLTVPVMESRPIQVLADAHIGGEVHRYRFQLSPSPRAVSHTATLRVGDYAAPIPAGTDHADLLGVPHLKFSIQSLQTAAE